MPNAMFENTLRCGKERVVLEDHRHVPVVRQFVGHVLAVEQDLAFGSDLEAGDDAHGRGLAAARRADEDNEFAVGGGQRKVLDRDDIGEALRNVMEFNRCHSISPPPVPLDASSRPRPPGFLAD